MLKSRSDPDFSFIALRHLITLDTWQMLEFSDSDIGSTRLPVALASLFELDSESQEWSVMDAAFHKIMVYLKTSEYHLRFSASQRTAWGSLFKHIIMYVATAVCPSAVSNFDQSCEWAAEDN